VFKGQDIPIDIAIKNISSFDVELPRQYLQEKGPYITLTDTETQQQSVLKTGLPKVALKKVFTTVKPGEVIHITSIIKAQEITAFRTKLIDLSARVEVTADLKICDREAVPGQPLIKFDTDGALHIVGRDTLELKKSRDM
jgi:hypothetical protein